jgi:hypothetical protein
VPVLAGVGLLLALPAVLALYSGAGSEDRAAVAAAAQEFLDALRAGNGQAVKPLVTAKASAIMAVALPGTAQLRMQLLRPRIDDVVVQHNNAVVHYTLLYEAGTVTIPGPAFRIDRQTLESQIQAIRETSERLAGQRGTLLLQREDGRWRVRGAAFPVSDGPGNPFYWDTDDPAPTSPDQLEAFRAFEELVAVDPRQWEASWKVDLDLKDVPARDALRDLGRGLGLPLVNLPQPFPALDRRVSLQFRGRSRMEAVEEVCRRAGVQPRYDAAGLHVTAGQRASPVAFAGPSLVEVVDVKEFLPQPTGKLMLRAVTGRIPAPGVALFRPEAPLRIDEIAAADGRDLYHAANQPFYKPPASPTRWREGSPFFLGELVVPLKNLLRDLDTVHRVRGRLPLLLPVRVDVIRFDQPVVGIAAQAGDARLTVRQVDIALPAGGPPVGGPAAPATPPVTALAFDAQGLDGRRVKFAAYDALGRKLKCGEPETPRPDLVRLEVPGEPATVVFKVVSLQEVEYAFELRDVPLRQRVPERLEPARFPGREAPVSVEFLAVVRPQERQGPAQAAPAKFPVVRLQLHNHCQKSVERVQLKLNYLDATGRSLKEVARNVATPNAFDGRLAVFESGKPFEVEERDLPDGAVKVAVTVTGVGFADGTAWPP